MKNRDIFFPYIKGKYEERDNELICNCPFCGGEKTFRVKDTTVYYCQFCKAKGNAVTFLKLMTGMTGKQAYDFVNCSYTISDFCEQYNFQASALKILGLDIKEDIKGLEIPFYNAENEKLATRILQKNKKIWSRGSKVIPFGLNKLKEFKDSSYIIVVDDEIDAISCLYQHIQALAFPELTTINESNASYLKDFEKIYICNNCSQTSKSFIRKWCQILPKEKLFTITPHEFAQKCFSISDLKANGWLSLENLFETLKPIDDLFYEESVEAKTINNIPQIAQMISDALPEPHIKIASQLLDELYVYCYKESFYVYCEGVYKKNLSQIEEKILEIEPNAKSSLRKEILDFIRIKRNYNKSNINEQFVNFKNGIYDIKNHKFINHTPLLFR